MPKPRLKGRIHLDKVVLKVGKTCYCMNAVDSRTKYNLESKFVKSRTLEAFDDFFKTLKERVGGESFIN